MGRKLVTLGVVVAGVVGAAGTRGLEAFQHRNDVPGQKSEKSVPTTTFAESVGSTAVEAARTEAPATTRPTLITANPNLPTATFAGTPNTTAAPNSGDPRPDNFTFNSGVICTGAFQRDIVLNHSVADIKGTVSLFKGIAAARNNNAIKSAFPGQDATDVFVHDFQRLNGIPEGAIVSTNDFTIKPDSGAQPAPNDTYGFFTICKINGKLIA